MKIVIDEKNNGKSILEFLRRTLGFSRRQITKLKFQENGITVNGNHKTVRYILEINDILEIMSEDTESDVNEKLLPKNIPIDVVYEDEYFTVINKPPYMPTHPSFGHYEDTLANALAYRYQSQGIPYVFRPVNRLDRNTSGLVLTANSRLSASKLANMIMEGKIQKTYIAVLSGRFESESGVISNYIRRKADTVILREQTDNPDNADLAITKYERIYVSDRLSVVKAMPVTGRTHQLRVHFSSLGNPIFGDDLYGGDVSKIERQALHAYKLEFEHPFYTDRKMSLTAELPEDIKNLIYDVTKENLIL